MAKKIGTGIPTKLPDVKTDGIEKKQVQEKKPFDPSQIDLPKKGLKDKSSPLRGVIEQGLMQLAEAEGWTGQQKALGVLCDVMMGGVQADEKKAPSSEASTLDFAQLLRGLSKDRRPSLNRDATQLGKLAVLSVGTDGLKGTKSAQEQQLKTDVQEIRNALSSVMEDGKSAHLNGLVDTLESFSGLLRQVDWKSAAANRIDAFAAMLKIVLKYAPTE